MDLSRTVGWFTTLFPVRLDLGSADVEEAMQGGVALGRALKRIKEQLHAVPDHGLGYGLLRYLNEETAPELRRFTPAQIGFNYLGLGFLAAAVISALIAYLALARTLFRLEYLTFIANNPAVRIRTRAARVS